MSYDIRRIFIIPAGRRDTVNTALAAKGYGPDNFSLACKARNSASNSAITHYACDVAMTTAMYNDFLNEVGPSGFEEDVGPLGTPNRRKTALHNNGLESKAERERG